MVAQDRRKSLTGGTASKGALAGEHFVQDAAEGEDVAAGIGRLAGNLLRRHIADRSDDHARLSIRGVLTERRV